jgi:P27 family predicted phage terminase small subunit
VWLDLSDRLDRMAALGLLDYYALAVFCDTWSRWRKARKFIEEHGDSHLVRDRAGNVKGVRFYPHVRLADRLAEQLVRMGRELGITPASRGRVAVIPHHVYPEWDRYLAKRPQGVQDWMRDPTLERPKEADHDYGKGGTEGREGGEGDKDGDDDEAEEDDDGGDDPGPGEGAPEGEGA